MKKIFIIPLLLAVYSCNPNRSNAESQSGDTDSVTVAPHADTVEVQVKKGASAEDLSVYFDEERAGSQILVQAKGISGKSNAVYCYFRLKDKKASGLRMRIQYWEAEYADADQYTFNVDGKKHTYIANRNKNVLNDARIVEGSTFYWYDDSLNKKDQAFLEALGNSEKASVSLIDRATNQVVATITISDEVKKSIVRTLEYYFALDGAVIPRQGMVNIRDY